MGKPTYFLLFYIISWVNNPLTWLIYNSRSVHFTESLPYISQNCGLWAPKILRGPSATQQCPNTIIVTHPESLGWFDNLRAEVRQQFLCFVGTCSKLIRHLLYLFNVCHRHISLCRSFWPRCIFHLHVCHLVLNGNGNHECLIYPRLETFFNHYFLVGNINLYFQSLGLLHLGQALCNHNHLHGPCDIIIGLLELSCLGFQSL